MSEEKNLNERIAEVSAELAALLAQKFNGRCVMSHFAAVTEYLKAKLVPLEVEEVRVLYLDSRNCLLADEVHSRGTVNEASVHVREVIHRAFDLGANALIIAHNHPSGDPTPSRQDISITQKLADAAKAIGMALHDHIIVGGAADPVSMRARGLLA